MSETNLPFNEKFYPNNTQPTSGEKRRQKWEKSIQNPQEFWAEKAKAIDWFKLWDKVLDDSNPPFYNWFQGGILNITYNALDRHVKTNKKNKIAYIWEGEMGETETYTYQQLHDEVNKFAQVLKTSGIKKGDRIAIYLPVIPELPIALLAAARLGAIHTVVFSGFSS
jgi:acetyl-CoA synthetase